MLTHRLAALILSLVLLSGLWAAATEPTTEIPESTTIERPSLPEHEGVTRTSGILWMKTEIAHLWSIYLVEQGFTIEETRKAQLDELAYGLALATERYQKVPSNWKHWLPMRRGTTLPRKADVHLMLATIAAIESKVNPKAVGKLGEVGILQCHKWCREGHSPQEIRNDPQLGIELGVRFMAKSIDQCGIKLDSLVSKKHQDEAWGKPVSVYGAGQKAIKNSRCVSKQFARWRVSEMIRFRTEIRKKAGGGDGREKVCERAATPGAAGSLRPDPV